MSTVKFCSNCGNPQKYIHNLYPCECLINEMVPVWVMIDLTEDNAWSVAKAVVAQQLREDGKITTDEKNTFLESCYIGDNWTLEEGAFFSGTFEFDFDGILECQYDNVLADIKAMR